MDLRTKLGQMVCVGFEGIMPPDELLTLIKKYKLGNFSLYAHNLKNKAQIAEMVSQLKKFVKEQTGFMPFICIDQEGGMVTRFPDEFTHFPGAMAVAAAGDTENAFKIGYATALEMRAVGFNTNHAPVVDVNTNPQNPVIGVRAYGDTPETVISYAMRMMEGLEQGGVMSMLKHFPGHGDTKEDSHFSLPYVDKTLDELLKTELQPYIEGIRRGVPSIMTSHIVFPKIDSSGVPATMSKVFITDILRNMLHFDGIVYTDDLEMEAIRSKFGIIEGGYQAVKAGVDIVSISRSPEMACKLIEKLENGIENGEIPESLIDAAFGRIIKYKKRYCTDDNPGMSCIGCAEHQELMRNVSRHSVALLRDPKGQLPVKGSVLVVGTNAYNQTNVRNPLLLELNMPLLLAQKLGGKGMTIAINPDGNQQMQVIQAASKADTVIFGTYNAHLYAGQLELAHLLAQRHSNVIFVAMRNPYDLALLDSNFAALAAYEYTPVSIETLGRILSGEQKALGRICVKLDSK